MPWILFGRRGEPVSGDGSFAFQLDVATQFYAKGSELVENQFRSLRDVNL
jgi:hypothetical protein